MEFMNKVMNKSPKRTHGLGGATGTCPLRGYEQMGQQALRKKMTKAPRGCVWTGFEEFMVKQRWELCSEDRAFIKA